MDYTIGMMWLLEVCSQTMARGWMLITYKLRM